MADLLKHHTKEIANIHVLEPIFLSNHFRPITKKTALKQLQGFPNFSQMRPFLPVSLGGVPLQEYSKPVEVEPEDFVGQMKRLGAHLGPKLPHYFGKETDLCMSLTAIIGNYLANLYRFPVIRLAVLGLADAKSEELPYYIRPITAIFDKQPLANHRQYRSNRFSLEELLEIKIRNKKYIVDFAYWYGSLNYEVLVQDISMVQQRKMLGERLGLWINYDNMRPSAKDYYRLQEVDLLFRLRRGDKEIIDLFVREVLPHKNSRKVYEEKWEQFRTKHDQKSMTIQEYIDMLSIGALISEGYKINDMSGYGKGFSVPKSYKEKSIILELPKSVDEI